MAVNIGPRIQIDGEAEYRRQLQNIIQTQKTLNSEMDKTASGFDKNASAQSKAKAKSDLLKNAIQNQEERVKMLKSALEACAEKFGENDTKTLKWKQALNEAETELNRLNSELRANSGIKAFGEDMQAVGQNIADIGDKISSIGDALTEKVSAPLVAMGTAASKLAMDFEYSMAKVATIADDGSVSMEQVRTDIMALSQDTGVAASEIAEAAYQAVSAGQSSADAVNFVSQAISLSKAGFTDVTTATDTLTTIMNAYGDSAGSAVEISDKLMTVQNKGKTTIAELGSAIGTVIPTAAMYSVNLDQVAAAYITMTKNGIKTSEATTYLNSMINELGKSGSTASDLLKEKTGKSFEELMSSGTNLTEVLTILQDAADEAGLSMGDMFGNQRAGKAAATMIQHVDDFNNGLDSLVDSAGATESACNKLADTTQSKLNKSINNLKNIGIEVGSEILPTIADVAERVGGVLKEAAKKFDSLSDSQKDMIIQTAAGVAAFGPLVSVVGRVISGIGNLTAAMGTLLITGVNPATIAVYGITAAVVGLTAAYIAGGGEAQFYAKNTWEIKTRVDAVSESVSQTVARVDSLTDSIRNSASGIETTGTELDYYKQKLLDCYDANGNLKDGMEETAEYMLTKLNEAMGTDYSTEFISQADDSVAALQEIADEVDKTVERMKAAALEEAFSTQWAEAIASQAEAQKNLTDATNAYNDAIADLADKQNSYNAALQEQHDTGKDMSDVLTQLSNDIDLAAESVQNARADVIEYGGAYAEASKDVTGLDDAMSELANGNIDPAITKFSNLSDAADNAGDRVRNDFSNSISDASDIMQEFENTNIRAPRLNSESLISSASEAAEMSKEKLDEKFSSPFYPQMGQMKNVDTVATTASTTISRKFDTPFYPKMGAMRNVQPVANSAYSTTQSIVGRGNTAKMTRVTNVSSAASSAYGTVQSIVGKGNTARLSGVTNVTSAAASAHSALQSYMNARSISVKIKGVISSVTSAVKGITGYASGGVITHQQLAVVGEGNRKEVIVPVEGDRARGLSLLNQAAQMLGVSPQYQALPSGSVTTNTANYGGVNINVYAAEGQSERAIASAVMDELNTRLKLAGAML